MLTLFFLTLLLSIGLVLYWYRRDQKYVSSDLADVLSKEMKRELNINPEHSDFKTKIATIPSRQATSQLLKSLNQNNDSQK